MPYRYQIWCTDRDNGCPNHCFNGVLHVSDEPFETPQLAYNAAYVAARECVRWDFTVVDEAGARVKMGRVAPVVEQKKRKHKKKERVKVSQ